MESSSLPHCPGPKHVPLWRNWGELIKHSTVATSEIDHTRSFGQETEVYPVVMDYRKIEPWLFVNFRCRAGKSDENCWVNDRHMTIGCAFVWCSHYHPKPRLTSPSKPIAKVTMPGQWGICAGRRWVTFSPPHVFTASDLCGHGVAEAVGREVYWKNMFQQINQSLETLKYIVSLHISLYYHLEDGPIFWHCSCVLSLHSYLNWRQVPNRPKKESPWILNHDSWLAGMFDQTHLSIHFS